MMIGPKGINRRQALVTIAAIAAARPAAAEPAFPNEDLRILARLVDIVIPRTDTPGASDVGAHLYIDRVASGDSGLHWTLEQGLAALRSQNFLQMPEGWQTTVFVDSPLFQTIKNLTIDAYYSTKEGLVDELGYHGNTYVAEFEGCTHREHQPEAGHQPEPEHQHAD
ncbi:MAG TPA: gluconate 2-dehydrogenase subunit 3 family protein [Bryobacteraceae bacterium]|nr:gluconate 2-dehydrogenase subunit 3 family protein [Bryobacteraceae bacterium]